MTRPPNLTPPDYLSKSPPVPKPKPAEPHEESAEEDRTRYGDWTRDGRAIDF